MAIYQSTGGPTAMRGTAADDTYLVRNTGDTVSEDPNGGYDVVIATVSYTRPANVEALAVVGGGLTATGTSGSDLLFSLQGGANTLVGLGGDDTYVVNNLGDVVTEQANGGFDTVYATVNFTIPANVEVLVARGSGLTATGSAGADILYSVDGANILVGGAGDDTYVVNNAGDRVIEAGGGGYDTVYAQVSYTIPANVEALTVRGSGLTARGSGASDVLTSLGGPNTLIGGGGIDTYYVNNPGDVVVQTAGSFATTLYTTVSYTAPANIGVVIANGSGLTVTGGGQTVALVSLGGPNTLITSPNATNVNSIYVNNVGDVVNAPSGRYLYSSVDYSMPASFGTARLVQPVFMIMTVAGTTGSMANNAVSGYISTTADNVTLIAGVATFSMTDNGHSGIRLIGSSTYEIGNSGTIISGNTSSISMVFASVSYTLPSDVMHMYMNSSNTIGVASPTGGSDVTARAAYVSLIGSNLQDTLVAGAANDTITGGGGNDSIYVNGNSGARLVYLAASDSPNISGQADIVYGSTAGTIYDLTAVGGGYTVTGSGDNIQLRFGADSNGVYQGLILIHQSQGAFSGVVLTSNATSAQIDAAPLHQADTSGHVAFAPAVDDNFQELAPAHVGGIALVGVSSTSMVSEVR